MRSVTALSSILLVCLGCGTDTESGPADTRTDAFDASPPETIADSASENGAGDTLHDPDDTDGADALEEVDPPLPAGVYALAGTDVTLPDDDLAPFAALIDGVEIIGLGESIHTSGGFYALKRRLIRYLIAEHGVRVFAMETPRTQAELAAAYIERCSGTSRQAMRGIFGVFAAAATQRLFEDLCDHNRAHPDDPVRFFGFDVQQPEDDHAALSALLEEMLPDEAGELLAPIEDHCLLVYDITPLAPEAYEACLDAIAAVDARIDANAAAWGEQLGEDELAVARLSVLGLASWQEEVQFFNSDPARSFQARDSAMAEVFTTLRRWRYPERTVVWAHDYHLRHRSLETTHEPVIDALGAQLFSTYGDAYQAFGISARLIGINWPGQGCGYRVHVQPESIERRVAELGPGDHLIDPLVAGAGPEPFLPLDTEQPYGLAGSSVPARQFRGIFVLADSPPMQGVYWGDCAP